MTRENLMFHPERIPAAYGRVSTSDQISGESPEIQEKGCLTFAKANGLDNIIYLADLGVSGISKDRPKWKQIMDGVRQGKIGLVITHSLTRAGRSAREILNDIQTIKDHGCNFVSISEGVNLKNPYGGFLLTILAAIAELEHLQIKERTNGGKISKWTKGECQIGKAPYGYRWKKELKCFEIVEEEASTVRQIVKMYLEEGLSFVKIAVKLKKLGIKGRAGKKNSAKYFSSRKIQYMLTNTAYYGKKFTEHYIYDLPVIIPKTEWDLIQQRRMFNKSKGKRLTKAINYWLRDLLECGECGGAVKPRHSNPRKDGGFQRYYSCYWHQISSDHMKAAGRTKCELQYIKADELESQVETQVIHDLGFDVLMGNKDNLIRLLSPENYAQRKKELEINLQSVLAEKRKKERGLFNLNELLEDTEFRKADFTEKYKLYVSEIETLETRAKSISQEIQELEIIIAENESFLKFARNNRQWLKNIQKELLALSPADKKKFYESIFLGKIELYQDGDESEGVPPHVSIKLPPIRLNATIFQSLSSEGKISHFHEKSLYKFARHHFP